ncbi:unnamed protein product [Rotaria socialis]|uniref:Uncharacterized protein n=1 Tax=Rotaria socialis TaxID=392032 RepID=A0A818XTQ4_9BILA|nr:unnamed protein product [Rotaria socialis]CAF4911791.1 unnamed protein product [Rotaria socialis]
MKYDSIECRPIIYITQEAAGCVSTIEDRLRVIRSNESVVGVSNDSVIPSNSNVDTSTCNKSMSSNSGEVVAAGNISPPSSVDQSSNVAQATDGINNSSIKNRGALNSDGKSLAVKKESTNNLSETMCILP